LFNRLKNEAGYSLVEVMVSIVILTIAIIPMVGMFDMSLNAATKGSNYDKARALANKQLERAKNLSYADARDKFPCPADPPASCPTNPPYTSGRAEILDRVDPDPEYSNFTYDIVKEYVALVADDATTMEFQTTGTNDDSKMVRITVTVRWGSDDYTTSGVVSE
jgi:prepilin-type N-terminal cleavage/methylation domain-containing protein